MTSAVCIASLAALLCGGEPSSARRTWWSADYPYRREVTIRGDGPGYAAIQFSTLGRALPGGADVRLIAEDKNLIGFVRIDAGRDDGVSLVCPIRDPRLVYRVYFGNVRARPLSQAYVRQASLTGESVRALPKAGLICEVRALGRGGADTLADMRALIAESGEVLGRELRSACAMARNPFDARDAYLVLWRGALAIPAAGTWRFATNSNGPSFVLVDGREVASWPGWHDARGGEMGSHAGEIALARGTHVLEYLYAARGGLHGHVCGLQGPGDEKMRPLGGGDLAPLMSATAGVLEDLHSPDVCDFTWQVAGGWGSYGDCVLVRFTDRSTLGGAEPAARTWAFGDGQTAEGKTAEHLFLECGVFQVALELASASGAVVRTAARVAIEPRDRRALDPAALAAASLGCDCARLSDGALRNLVLLRWEDPEARGFSDAAKVFFDRKPAISSEALARCAGALLDEVFLADEIRTVALGEYLLAAAPDIELRTRAAAAAADTLRHLMGRRDDAERVLRRALAPEGGGAGAAAGPLVRVLLGELLDARGKKEEAAAMIAGAGGGSITEYLRGELTFRIGAHLEKKEFGRAWEALNAWLVADPALACGDAPFFRARILSAAGRARPALEELERFLPRARGALRKEALARAESLAADLGLTEKSAAFARRRAEEFPAGDGAKPAE
ncbi:MAG TPA: hypothetical protein DCM87_20815 [Planctomycetes bacterium]|nr:hypothetical protein [Planctomycetota bacterium]